ncbi:MAG TPA: histidine phosphatase family protein [Gaiellaceae bacterium]|nr:histidine phosphatase family protein [Gaiellaceae bacterium]
MRLFVLARHGESALNVERRVNGDPTVDVPLTERGEEEARTLGQQVSEVPFDACVHTRFPRSRMTAEIALGERVDVPLVEEPLLDDIDIGSLEGEPVERYREWKHGHSRDVPFPGGESLDDAARRYAEAFRRLAAGSHTSVLVVCHEIPVRYALNGASGSDSLDGPAHEIANAMPYLFDEDALERAVRGIERVVGRIPA